MTIKELESKTGMTRANIRFYEGEGLLAPKRLDNGYRDYSEEDARTLEKIKLLRQIGLDIDTIRKVQNGALTLEQALFTQHTKLEGDKVVLERAAEVCRELERSGVEYAALDPQPYLRKLEAPTAPERISLPPPLPKPERDDTPRACYHPWQRFFARILDDTLYSTAFRLAWLFLFRDQGIVLAAGNVLLSWLLGLLSLAFALAVEPLWLHFWGWTPGKWVFGLKLRGEDGNKLPLSQGWQRSKTLAWEGYGWNIPIYSLWLLWQNRKDALKGWYGGWNSEYACRYTKEERRIDPAVIFVAISAVCVAALVVGLKYTQTPPNRGELTVEEYAENYNYYFRQLIDQHSTGLPTLSSDGHWVEKEAPTGGHVVIYLFGDTTVWSDPIFTLEGDRVLAVQLHMESSDTVVGGDTQEWLALLAMTGALDNLNLFNYDLRGWLNAYEKQASPWQNAEFTYRGLHVSRQVECSGYSYIGDQLWQTDDNTPCRCEKTLTISLADP